MKKFRHRYRNRYSVPRSGLIVESDTNEKIRKKGQVKNFMKLQILTCFNLLYNFMYCVHIWTPFKKFFKILNILLNIFFCFSVFQRHCVDSQKQFNTIEENPEAL